MCFQGRSTHPPLRDELPDNIQAFIFLLLSGIPLCPVFFLQSSSLMPQSSLTYLFWLSQIACACNFKKSFSFSLFCSSSPPPINPAVAGWNFGTLSPFSLSPPHFQLIISRASLLAPNNISAVCVGVDESGTGKGKRVLLLSDSAFSLFSFGEVSILERGTIVRKFARFFFSPLSLSLFPSLVWKAGARGCRSLPRRGKGKSGADLERGWKEECSALGNGSRSQSEVGNLRHTTVAWPLFGSCLGCFLCV